MNLACLPARAHTRAQAPNGFSLYTDIMFLDLAQRGLGNNWDEAAKTVYGFETVDDLQQAWLEWLKKPETRLADSEPDRGPPPAANPELIPPTKLPTTPRSKPGM